MEHNAIPSQLEVFSNPNPPYNVQLRFISSPEVQSVRFENNYYFEKAFGNYLLLVAQDHENGFNIYPSMGFPQIPVQSPKFLTGPATVDGNFQDGQGPEIMAQHQSTNDTAIYDVNNSNTYALPPGASSQYTNNIPNDHYDEDVSGIGATSINPYTSPPPKAKHSGSLFTQVVNVNPTGTTGASAFPIAASIVNHRKSSSSHSLKDSASTNITLSTSVSPSTPKASVATTKPPTAYGPSEPEGPRHRRIESTSSTTSSGAAPIDHHRSNTNFSTPFSSTTKAVPNTTMSTPLTTGPTIWSPVSAGTTTDWKFPSGGALAGRRTSGSGGGGGAIAIEKGDDSPTLGKGRVCRRGSYGAANSMTGGPGGVGEASAPTPAPTTTSTSTNSRESMMNFLRESSRRQSVATTARSSVQGSSIKEEPDEDHDHDRDYQGSGVGGMGRGLDFGLRLRSLGGGDASVTAAGTAGFEEGLGRVQTTGSLVGLGHHLRQSSGGSGGGAHASGSGSPWGPAGGKRNNTTINGRALRSDTA